MSDPTPTVFLSPPSRIIPHTPPSLPATLSPSPQLVHRLPPFDPTRNISQKCSPVGQQRVSSIDPDPTSEQSRVTMQTRVAVRDTTPHRFQVIPLREHKRSNIPDTHHGRSNEPRCRSHELLRPAYQQISVSEPLSVRLFVFVFRICRTAFLCLTSCALVRLSRSDQQITICLPGVQPLCSTDLGKQTRAHRHSFSKYPKSNGCPSRKESSNF